LQTQNAQRAFATRTTPTLTNTKSKPLAEDASAEFFEASSSCGKT
jgi:hypothetical protein